MSWMVFSPAGMPHGRDENVIPVNRNDGDFQPEFRPTVQRKFSGRKDAMTRKEKKHFSGLIDFGFICWRVKQVAGKIVLTFF